MQPVSRLALDGRIPRVGLGARRMRDRVATRPQLPGLGLGFPLGLALCERMERKTLSGEHGDHTDGSALGPWLWGINGACGVCASGLALGTSMVFGVNVTLLVGAACYLLLPVASE